MKKLTIVLLMVFLIIVNVSVAQMLKSGEIETEIDNRGIAMGRTAIASSAGSSAIFSNPAILATLKGQYVQVGGWLLSGSIKDESAENRHDKFDAKYSPALNRSHFSFSMPYQFPDSEFKISFGVGYQRNHGYKQAVEFKDEEETAEVTLRTCGDLSMFTPAVAINIIGKYFIGASFNRVVGKITITGEAEATVTTVTTETETGRGLTETETKKEKSKVEVEVDQSGSFVRIGALAKLTPKLTAGFMYRPKFDWEWDDIKYEEYEDGKLTDTDKEEGGDVTIPGVLGLGVEYKASPQLIVAGEFQTRPFSDFKFDQALADLWFNQALVDLWDDIDDGYCYRLGAEYLGLTYPIRFGVFRDAILKADEDDDTPRSLMGITGGTEASIGNISLHASVLYGTWIKEYSEGHDYSEKLFRFGVSATFKFD